MAGVEDVLKSWHLRRPPPPGWEIEPIPRENPKYFGKVDIYYYEPVTNRRFRSYKKAWEQYRQTLQQSQQPGFVLPAAPTSTSGQKSKKMEYDGEFEKLDPERVEWVREKLAETRRNFIEAFK